MIYLKQTETTVGFLSKKQKDLNILKQREIDKPLIKEVTYISDIKHRVPKKFRKQLRNSKNITYILPSSHSYRVAPVGSEHHKFLKKHGEFYSTSANKSGEKFYEKWAKKAAQVVVFEPNGFCESKPSNIFKLYKNKQQRIR